VADRDFDMSGILFRETDKKNEKGPDYTGKLTVLGIDYRLAGWIREGKSGKFLSLKVSVPDAQRGGGGGQRQRDDDDRIPFILPGDLPPREVC